MGLVQSSTLFKCAVDHHFLYFCRYMTQIRIHVDWPQARSLHSMIQDIVPLNTLLLDQK